MVNCMLGSIDIRNIVNEFKFLETGRINKVYHDKNKYSFKLHTKSGDLFLNIVLPGMIFLSQNTKYSKETPSATAMTLRKHLENAVITSISQHKSERIIEMTLQKADQFRLVIELFNKGNIILTKDNKILALATSVKSTGRELRYNSEYKPQEEQFDFLNCKKEDFIDKIVNSQKDSIVLSLATEIALGGHYSEEICLRAEIQKQEKPSKETATAAYKAFLGLLKDKCSPAIVERKDKIPLLATFELGVFKDEKRTYFDTISLAVEAILQMSAPAMKNQELERLSIILSQQEESMKRMESEVIENKRKGELIYENYGFIKEILDIIEQKKQKMHLKEIMEALAKHPKIKKADAKVQKITIEL